VENVEIKFYTREFLLSYEAYNNIEPQGLRDYKIQNAAIFTITHSVDAFRVIPPESQRNKNLSNGVQDIKRNAKLELKTHRKPDLFKREGKDIIIARVKGIINKLSMETVDRLSETLNKLLIEDDYYLLKSVVTLIFEKALWEPKFAFIYAELVKRAAKIVATVPETGATISFRTLFLNRAQELFETKLGTTLERAADSETAREEIMLRKRKLIFGNIQLIGVLFNINVLPKKIIHECISKLIHDIIQLKSEDDIEILCKLMALVGEKIDIPEAKTRVDSYFKIMEEFSQYKEIPRRTSFMICDVLDFRKQLWKPRAAQQQVYRSIFSLKNPQKL